MSPRRLVVNVSHRPPIWRMPDWAEDQIRAGLPDDWQLTVIRVEGPGGSPVPPEVIKAARGARAYVGFGIPESVIEAGRSSLLWVHTGAAGVRRSLHEALSDASVTFTNSAGIHGPPIAESVVGMLLYFARGLDLAVAAQQQGRWDDQRFQDAETPVRELADMVVGVVGYGGIGREVGKRVAALGADVIGLRRTQADDHSAGDRVTLWHGERGLKRLLEESDAVVLTAPETDETRGLLSAERIGWMKRGAILVNVSRGGLVDEVALVAALHQGRLRGAGLDVFHEEPLPPDHPLWTIPNVLITPHVSATTQGFWRREVDLILENLGRLVAGKPLLNEVDRSRGY